MSTIEKTTERYCDRCEIDIEPGQEYEEGHDGFGMAIALTCMPCVEINQEMWSERSIS